MALLMEIIGDYVPSILLDLEVLGIPGRDGQ
jgi:hypothetical protein